MRHINPVLAHDLAIGQIGVSIDAGLRSQLGSVEEVQIVDISGGELGRLDIHIVKHASSLVDRGRISTAHESHTVVGQTSVEPAILLGNRHDILNRHALVSSNFSDARHVVTVTVEALVQTLDVQVVHGTGNDFLEHGEHDW